MIGGDGGVVARAQGVVDVLAPAAAVLRGEFGAADELAAEAAAAGRAGTASWAALAVIAVHLDTLCDPAGRAEILAGYPGWAAARAGRASAEIGAMHLRAVALTAGRDRMLARRLLFAAAGEVGGPDVVRGAVTATAWALRAVHRRRGRDPLAAAQALLLRAHAVLAGLG